MRDEKLHDRDPSKNRRPCLRRDEVVLTSLHQRQFLRRNEPVRFQTVDVNSARHLQSARITAVPDHMVTASSKGAVMQSSD